MSWQLLSLQEYRSFQATHEYLLHIAHVSLELLLRVRQIGALAAGPLVVHLEDVGGQALGARRLVVAEQADEGLCVRVEVPLETPLVRSGPRAVAAGEALLALWLQQAGVAAAIAVGMTAAATRTGAGHRLLHDVEREDSSATVVKLLLLELGQGHVGRGGHRLDGLHDAQAGRGGMPLRLQEGVVDVDAAGINGYIAATAGVVRPAAGGAAARRSTASRHMPSRLINVVLELPVHAQKVLLDVIGAVELLEAGIALEWLLVLVDVLVPGVQIPAVRRIRTVGAGVPLLDVNSVGGCGSCLGLGLLAATAASARGAGAAAAAVAGR